jgi:microcystin-dependent protein
MAQPNNVNPYWLGQFSSTALGLPVGTILMYGALTPPAGFLNCNGSAVSRTTYSLLFSVIGTAFGVGNGSTTFNLPDTTNNTVRGGYSIANIGTQAGADNYILDITSIPPHSHGLQQNGLNFTGGGTVSSLQPNPAVPNTVTDGAIRLPNSTTVITAAGDTPRNYNVVNRYITIPSIIKYA